MVSILIYILFLTLTAFILNLPFGYFRSTSAKFSFSWFLYIHVPIPFIIVLRWALNVDYRVVPVVVLAAAGGQFLGGRFNRNLNIK